MYIEKPERIRSEVIPGKKMQVDDIIIIIIIYYFNSAQYQESIRPLQAYIMQQEARKQQEYRTDNSE